MTISDSLLKDILAELQEQRKRLSNIEEQLTHRSSPQKSTPRGALTIRFVTACDKEKGHWHWMNSVEGPGHRPTTNCGHTKKGLVKAELLAFYSALQQVIQYQAATKLLCIRTTCSWIEEMVQNDAPGDPVSEENWSLANDILDMLFKLPNIDVKKVTFSEDYLLTELAEKLLKYKNEQEKVCSQLVETESSQKTAKLLSDKDPTESSSTSTSGSRTPINLEGI